MMENRLMLSREPLPAGQGGRGAGGRASGPAGSRAVLPMLRGGASSNAAPTTTVLAQALATTMASCIPPAEPCRHMLTLAHELLAQHVARLEGQVAAHGCGEARRRGRATVGQAGTQG